MLNVAAGIRPESLTNSSRANAPRGFRRTFSFSANAIPKQPRPSAIGAGRLQPLTFLKIKMRTGSGVVASGVPTVSATAWRNSSKRTSVSRPSRGPTSV